MSEWVAFSDREPRNGEQFFPANSDGADNVAWTWNGDVTGSAMRRAGYTHYAIVKPPADLPPTLPELPAHWHWGTKFGQYPCAIYTGEKLVCWATRSGIIVDNENGRSTVPFEVYDALRETSR